MENIKALNTVPGWDTVSNIEENMPADYILKLSKIIPDLPLDLDDDVDVDDIAIFLDIDTTAIVALSELYFMFKDTGKISDAILDEKSPLHDIKGFEADERALRFLRRHLMDIQNDLSDEEYEEWKNHIEGLIKRINEEIKMI